MTVEVVHHEPAEGFEVAQVGGAVADAVEVVEIEIDIRFTGDGQQVQDGIGGTAEGHGDRDGVLQRGLGDDVAGGDAETDQVDHCLAGAVREGVTPAVRCGR